MRIVAIINDQPPELAAEDVVLLHTKYFATGKECTLSQALTDWIARDSNLEGVLGELVTIDAADDFDCDYRCFGVTWSPWVFR